MDCIENIAELSPRLDSASSLCSSVQLRDGQRARCANSNQSTFFRMFQFPTDGSFLRHHTLWGGGDVNLADKRVDIGSDF
jgi:hypothetical protein